jgi:hypothetical protein
MEVLEPTNEPKEKTIHEQNLDVLRGVLEQAAKVFGDDPNARFYAKPGFIGREPGVLDCEIITVQVFLPKNEIGAAMADHLIRQQKGDSEKIGPRIIEATAVGRG